MVSLSEISQIFLGMTTFSKWIQKAYKGYRDELSLGEFANISNVEIEVVSTLGNDDQISISPENSNPFGRITLGHFAEGQGDHYVCLQREIAEDDEIQQQDLDDIADNIVENNAGEIVPIRDRAK